MTLNQLRDKCFENSIAHGFWSRTAILDDKSDTIQIQLEISQKLMLMVEELAEAFGEIRSGKGPTDIYCNDIDFNSVEQNNVRELLRFIPVEWPPNTKPEGFPIELADCIIRILDLCGALGIDIEEAIRLKMEYNKSRPFKHGRQF